MVVVVVLLYIIWCLVDISGCCVNSRCCVAGLASLHQHLLQKSISEDSLQDGPTNQR